MDKRCLEHLFDSRAFDLCDLSLEDFERLCQASLAGEFIPLDDCSLYVFGQDKSLQNKQKSLQIVLQTKLMFKKIAIYLIEKYQHLFFLPVAKTGDTASESSMNL